MPDDWRVQAALPAQWQSMLLGVELLAHRRQLLVRALASMFQCRSSSTSSSSSLHTTVSRL